MTGWLAIALLLSIQADSRCYVPLHNLVKNPNPHRRLDNDLEINFSDAVVRQEFNSWAPIDPSRFSFNLETDHLLLAFDRPSLKVPTDILAVEKSSGAPVGNSTFYRRRVGNQATIYIHRARWQIGYGIEMKYSILRYAFEQLKVTQFMAPLDDGNFNTKKLHSRLGFVPSNRTDGGHRIWNLSLENWNSIQLELERRYLPGNPHYVRESQINLNPYGLYDPKILRTRDYWDDGH